MTFHIYRCPLHLYFKGVTFSWYLESIVATVSHTHRYNEHGNLSPWDLIRPRLLGSLMQKRVRKCKQLTIYIYLNIIKPKFSYKGFDWRAMKVFFIGKFSNSLETLLITLQITAWNIFLWYHYFYWLVTYVITFYYSWRYRASYRKDLTLQLRQ